MEGRKEMFYFNTHSTHFVRTCLLLFHAYSQCRRKHKWNEGNVLFNDALNTFYLQLYGVTHMVKDHSDSERGNPLPPPRLLFPNSSKFFFNFYMHHPTDRIAHTTAFGTPAVEHWPEREITYMDEQC